MISHDTMYEYIYISVYIFSFWLDNAGISYILSPISYYNPLNHIIYIYIHECYVVISLWNGWFFCVKRLRLCQRPRQLRVLRRVQRRRGRRGQRRCDRGAGGRLLRRGEGMRKNQHVKEKKLIFLGNLKEQIDFLRRFKGKKLIFLGNLKEQIDFLRRFKGKKLIFLGNLKEQIDFLRRFKGKKVDFLR